MTSAINPRSVARERARLAIEDPDGELEALAPLTALRAHQLLDDAAEPDAPVEHVGQALETFLATDPGPVRWFGPIVEGGTAAFVGRPETFKSFAALQLGLAGACGGSWLGIDLGEPRAFVYISAEKSRATVRDRLARMIRVLAPVAPVWIVHRAGVTFGDAAAWGRVRQLVEQLGPRTFVVVDTIASLAGQGFDENNGRDMATVLAALRQLGDSGATVAALHHPSKHGDGAGGIRLRGHTSLWGEVDATIEFTRPDRAVEAGLARVEPKDGDLRLIPFRWSRDTFLLEAESGILPLTAVNVAGVVEALYDGTALSSERVGAEFPGHGRTILLDRLREAVEAGLIARIGRARATSYLPIPRVMRADDTLFDRPAEPDPGEADRPPSDPVSSGEGGQVHEGIVRSDAESSTNRPGAAQAGESIVRGGGSIRPHPDDSPADDPVADDGLAATVDCRDYAAHQSQHRQVADGWICSACEDPLPWQ